MSIVKVKLMRSNDLAGLKCRTYIPYKFPEWYTAKPQLSNCDDMNQLAFQK